MLGEKGMHLVSRTLLCCYMLLFWLLESFKLTHWQQIHLEFRMRQQQKTKKKWRVSTSVSFVCNDFKLMNGPIGFPHSNITMLKCAEHLFRGTDNEVKTGQTFKALAQQTVGPGRKCVAQHNCVRVPKCYQTARDKRHRISCMWKRERGKNEREREREKQAKMALCAWDQSSQAASCPVNTAPEQPSTLITERFAR